MTFLVQFTYTSNVTGHHRGPKQKLQAGYRAPSLKRTSYLCSLLLCHTHYIIHRGASSGMLCKLSFSLLSVVSRAISVLCMYSTSGHHPDPLGYLCAKFCSHGTLHCWANPRTEKSRTQSISQSLTHSFTQLIWCSRNRSFCFRNT